MMKFMRVCKIIFSPSPVACIGCIFFIFITTITVHWQDRIVMKRGDTLTVRLMEVKPDTVRFKNPSPEDSSQYIVLGKNIRKIIFEDGHEVITQICLYPE